MKKQLNSVRIVGLFALIITFILSCQRDAQVDSLQQAKIQESSQVAQDNSSMIAAMQDAVNLTGNAFAQQGMTYGRVASDGEDGDECRPTITNTITIDRSHPDSLIISGMLIIDFGDGTSCDSAHVRKGKIIDSLMLIVVFKNGVVFRSHEEITFQDYWRNSTQIDGSISVDASTGNPTIVRFNGSRIRYHDGTSSSWTGSLVFTHKRDSTGNTITVTGSWSGTTRKGITFSANITNPIVYKAGCFGYTHRFIAVSGTVEIMTNGVTSTIDYGDGSCDLIYTITTAGVTTQHRLT